MDQPVGGQTIGAPHTWTVGGRDTEPKRAGSSICRLGIVSADQATVAVEHHIASRISIHAVADASTAGQRSASSPGVRATVSA